MRLTGALAFGGTALLSIWSATGCKTPRGMSDSAVKDYDIRFGGKWHVVGAETDPQTGEQVVKVRACTKEEVDKAIDQGLVGLDLNTCKSDAGFKDLPIEKYRTMLGIHFSAKDLTDEMKKKKVAAFFQQKFEKLAQQTQSGQIDIRTVTDVPEEAKADMAKLQAHYQAKAKEKAEEVARYQKMEQDNGQAQQNMQRVLEFVLPKKDSQGQEVKTYKLITPDSWEFRPLMYPFLTYNGVDLKQEDINYIKQLTGQQEVQDFPFQQLKAVGDPKVIDQYGSPDFVWYYNGTTGSGDAPMTLSDWVPLSFKEAVKFCNKPREKDPKINHLPTTREVAGWYLHRKHRKSRDYGLTPDGKPAYFWVSDGLNAQDLPKKTGELRWNGRYTVSFKPEQVDMESMNLGRVRAFAPYDGSFKDVSVQNLSHQDAMAYTLCSQVPAETNPADLNQAQVCSVYFWPNNNSTKQQIWVGIGGAAAQAAKDSCAKEMGGNAAGCKMECRPVLDYAKQ